MTPVCPFVKATRPEDGSSKKVGESQNKTSSPVCPFVKATRPEDGSSKKVGESQNKTSSQHDSKSKSESSESTVNQAKCPFGYDSNSFKLGPLSCIICQALLFDSSRCVPCSHVYCKACISRFNDCPICGADIEKIEPDTKLQEVVDRFIDGHARVKRCPVNTDEKEDSDGKKTVIYEDVSLERGAFLVQHAMRAFRAQNIESAKSRLAVCAEDIREQLERLGDKPELCSQLGAILGMLGDFCRASGDATSAVTHFEESVNFLSKLPNEDTELAHTLSVSLNKIGDLKYYDGDLEAARSYYLQSLDVRRNTMKNNPTVLSQVLDVAVSLSKVADVDRGIGNEDAAVSGFQEALGLLESLKINSNEQPLEQRRLSVLEFLKNQINEKQPGPAS